MELVSLELLKKGTMIIDGFFLPVLFFLLFFHTSPLTVRGFEKNSLPFSGCHNQIMSQKELIKESMNRYRVLDELDNLERESITLEIRWKRRNSILVLGRELGLDKRENTDEQIVRDRWVKIKNEYEQRVY